MLNKNHYIQNRLVKNFAIKAENGKYKICVLDLIKFGANYRNTDNCFCQKNLYDMASGDDVKELEKKFNDLIEKPMSKLLQRICSAKETVSFARTELNIVKKYFLLQHYRTPRNRMSYIPKYFTQEDKFIYTIQTVNKDETIYLNHLIMNEAYCYIGCKTPNELIPSIRKYNELRAAGQQNMHHDFNGYVELLSKL